MMKKFLFFAIFLLLFPLLAYGKSVFILNSYNKEDLCGGPQYQGVLKALKENFLTGLELEEYFLDSKRLSQKEVQKKIDEAVKKIRIFDPNVLVVVDDLAFKVALTHFLNKKDLVIVFSGVNRPLEDYNQEFNFLDGLKPTKNVVGVYENLFMKEQIEFLQFILGKNFNIALLYSTDFMGKILKRQIIDELKNTPYINMLVTFPITTMNDLQRAVQEISRRADIKAYMPLVMSVLDEKTNRNLTPGEVAPFLISHLCLLDVFPNNKGAIKTGYFGGVGIDFFAMGYQAGMMAVRLLNGYSLSKMKVEYAREYTILINKKRADSCGVYLPPEILNMADEVVE